MGPPPRAVQDLPVGDTVKAAYRGVFGRFNWLIRAALVPFLLSVLIMILALPVDEGSALLVVLGLLTLVPSTLFAVAWHRAVLLDQAPPVIPSWQSRHWRFLGYFLIVTAVSYGMSFIYAPILASVVQTSRGLETTALDPRAAFAAFILLVLVMYLFLRISFVFPAVAVDEIYGLGMAWRHSRGQGLRLFGAMFLAMILAYFGAMIVLQVALTPFLGMLRDSDDSTLAPIVLEFLNLAITYILIALSLSVISIAFRTCTGWIPDVPGPPAGPPAVGPAEDGQDT